MSQVEVELLRKGIDAWNRRDVDLWLNYAAPQIQWLPAGPAAVEREVYRGYDEVRSGTRLPGKPTMCSSYRKTRCVIWAIQRCGSGA